MSLASVVLGNLSNGIIEPTSSTVGAVIGNRKDGWMLVKSIAPCEESNASIKSVIDKVLSSNVQKKLKKVNIHMAIETHQYRELKS